MIFSNKLHLDYCSLWQRLWRNAEVGIANKNQLLKKKKKKLLKKKY